MGRLAGSICYNIGAMDRVSDGGVGWRNEITPYLRRRGVFVINPTDKPTSEYIDEFEGRAKINQLKKENKFDEIREGFGDQVRGVDLSYVDKASFLVCSLDLNAFPCGTWEEIFWANRCKKPILIKMEGGRQNVPNWLILTLPSNYFFNTWEDLFKYLDYVDNPNNVLPKKERWKFIDWTKLVKDTLDVYDFKAGKPYEKI